MDVKQIEEIDYNYHTSPDVLQSIIDKNGGLVHFLTFCQLHHIEIYRGGDYMYGLIVDKQLGTWSTELDGFSALIIGIVQYGKHNKSLLDTNNNVIE